MIQKTSRALLVLIICCLSTFTAQSGNPDRSGEAGAYELLINPWARSAGFMGMNSSRVTGLEAMRFNVAGLAFTNKTEVLFSRTQWLQGSEVGINSAGIAQKFGKDKGNVLGISIMSISFGEIERTTFSSPDGGIGTFEPRFLNIGVAYSRAFSESIYAGALVRIINERIDNLGASGVAIDAGLQYVTGPKDNIRFGIAIRNVGTPMKYSGDGLSFRGQAPGKDFQQSLNQKTESFELPSLLNIGASYDLYVDNIKNEEEVESKHRLTIALNFTSNSFGKDYFGGGIEYSFMEYFMIRGGYRYEDGITSDETRTNAHLGFGGGLSIEVPVNFKKKTGPKIGIDYAYAASSPFSGTHTIGARFNL